MLVYSGFPLELIFAKHATSHFDFMLPGCEIFPVIHFADSVRCWSLSTPSSLELFLSYFHILCIAGIFGIRILALVLLHELKLSKVIILVANICQQMR